MLFRQEKIQLLGHDIDNIGIAANLGISLFC